MRLSFPNTARFDLMALHAALAASSIPGITGISTDYDQLFVELPTRDDVTDEELAAIEQLVAVHAAIPSWDEVRRKRVHLLLEADWRIQRAEDLGEDTAPLRAYRQALRDVTTQPDPHNVTWPAAPWRTV
ncbi:MAG: phage tail assembly chaperone [Candidatus Sericytochromatia bacterium]|nr:phage tail assembly chaperone [Candidatus Sericytochromatia bacterium]